MKIIRFIVISARLAHNRWAMREISPSHPDVPHLVLETHELNDRLREIFT